MSHWAIPPPLNVGLAAAAVAWWFSTTTVTSALGAGAIAAVVYVVALVGSCPDVNRVCVMPAAGGVTVTVAVCVIAVPLAVAETVLASATLELSVAVATPFTPVVPEAPVIALPLPVALTTTVAPDSGLPKASMAVTVIVEVPVLTGMEVGE